MASLHKLLVPTALAVAVAAQTRTFHADLELLQGAPHPYVTPQPFSGSIDAVWNVATRSFVSFSLIVEGGYPTQSQFTQPFVYVMPYWADLQSPYRYALPMVTLPSAATTCCGYYWDAVTRRMTYRLDGFDLPPIPSIPPWVADIVKNGLDEGLVKFAVYNYFDCPGCVVTGIGSPNDGQPILAKGYGFASSGTGCPAVAPPTLDLQPLSDPPNIGRTPTVEVSSLPLDTAVSVLFIGTTRISVPLDALLGAPGCTAYVSGLLLSPSMLGTAPTATVDLALPNNSSLIGAVLEMQTLGLSVGLGWVVSNRGTMIIGS